MLHKLPVVLKPNTNFPSLEGDDEANIMPAFLKLINLFRIFDQSGAFDILQNSDTDTFNVGDLASASHISLQLLRRKLQEVSIDWDSSNDVQTADICVTRQWMQAVLWKVSMRTGSGGSAEDQITSLSHPIQIAKEFLSVIEQLPGAAIEAHGPSMVYSCPSPFFASGTKTLLRNTKSLRSLRRSQMRCSMLPPRFSQSHTTTRKNNRKISSISSNGY